MVVSWCEGLESILSEPSSWHWALSLEHLVLASLCLSLGVDLFLWDSQDQDVGVGLLALAYWCEPLDTRLSGSGPWHGL